MVGIRALWKWRVHQLLNQEYHPSSERLILKSPLPVRDSVFKCTQNKVQMNHLLCEQILNNNNFLKHVTHDHHLVVTGDDAVPTEVCKGRKRPNLQLASKHEEADIIMTLQAILIGHEPQARISVVADDTDDVFALLIHHYAHQNLKCPMIVQSPIHGRTCVDIPAIVMKHRIIIPHVLAVHSLSGCDTVVATYGVGKVTAMSVAQKGLKLDTLGKIGCDMKQVWEGGNCMYGCMLWHQAEVCRQRMWALKSGRNTTSAPKLCSLQPATEAFVQNVSRCHYQVAHWYRALE